MEDGGTVIMEMAGGVLATVTGGYWLPRWAGELSLTARVAVVGPLAAGRAGHRRAFPHPRAAASDEGRRVSL